MFTTAELISLVIIGIVVGGYVAINLGKTPDVAEGISVVALLAAFIAFLAVIVAGLTFVIFGFYGGLVVNVVLLLVAKQKFRKKVLEEGLGRKQ